MTPESNPMRRPRSDVERNRARLLSAAKRVFAHQGAAASLEQIARDAEVGIGTLYRHFPTRDALIEAVYRQETDTLVDAAAPLMARHDPETALREWLLLFVEYIDTKHGMKAVLSTIIGGPDALYSSTPARLAAPIGALVQRAVDAGVIRIGVEPLDLVRAVGGVANVSPDPNWKQSAVRMIDLLLAGLRSRG